MKNLKNKFLMFIFLLGTVALPAMNALATQHSNAFSLYAFYADKDAGGAAIVVDTMAAIGAATILCGIQAAVALGIAG